MTIFGFDWTLNLCKFGQMRKFNRETRWFSCLLIRLFFHCMVSCGPSFESVEHFVIHLAHSINQLLDHSLLWWDLKHGYAIDALRCAHSSSTLVKFLCLRIWLLNLWAYLTTKLIWTTIHWHRCFQIFLSCWCCCVLKL